MEEKKKQESILLNTKKVDEIIKKENYGVKLKLHEKIWFKNLKGVRKGNLTYAMTNEELNEYARCKMSVQYFAQAHCQIKREDGTIGPMTLRDYQKDIIDLYTNNRFSILMASRQTGKCNLFSVKVLQESPKGLLEEKTLGEVYFEYLMKNEPLSFLDNIKYKLYKLYKKLS